MTTPNEEIDVDRLPASVKQEEAGDANEEKKKNMSGDAIKEPVQALEEDEEAIMQAGKPNSDDDDDKDALSSTLQEEAEPDIKPTFFSDDKGNLKFVNLVVRYPCCIFTGILLLCVVISILLVFVLVQQEGNPFTEPENDYDLEDIRSLQYDSLRLAYEHVDDTRKYLSQGVSIPRQSEYADFTYWVFEGERSEGVFGSEESIKAMKEAFDLFLQDSDYDQYCLLKYPPPSANSGNDNNASDAPQPYCDIPISPLTLYYASEWDEEKVAAVIEELKDPTNIERFNALALCFTLGAYCDLLGETSPEDTAWALQLSANLTTITSTWDMKGENIISNISQATELAAYLKLIDVFKGLVDFGYDSGFSVENQISKYSRGVLVWGGPLADDLLSVVSTPEEKDELDEEDEDKRKDYIVDNFLSDMNDLASTKTHDSLNSYYFMGALLFDVVVDIIQRDALLAIVSIVFVFLWLRINTGSWFLALVGILEIIFSIPVAWFIFSVVFQINFFAFLNALSLFIVAAIGADDIFIFMDAYKQSKYRHPEHLVSLETRMSWVYRKTGTAMAITSATTCAAFLCTLLTPLTSIRSFGIFAAVVILIDYALVMSLFCTAVVIYHDRFEDRGCCGCCCTDCSISNPSPTQKAQQGFQSSASQQQEGDKVGLFFRTKVAGFVQVSWHRLVVGALFFTWIGIAAWQLSKLEPIRETEQFLDANHPLQKSITIITNEFPTAEDDVPLRVYYAWGVGEVDRSGVNLLLDPENSGEPVFLESFDFNEQCQTELVKACDKLKTDPQYQGLIKRKGGLGQTYCFLEELAAFYLKGDLTDCDYVKQGTWRNESWQIPTSELASIMPEFLQKRSCYEQTETIGSYYDVDIGWDGSTMKYAGISVDSEVLDPFSQDPEHVTRAEYDQFVALATELDQVVSEHCSGPVVMTDLNLKFVFMNNQAIYVQTAAQGSALGICIAFVVLLLATRTLHIAFFASLSIMSVLVSVTGTMVMLGWQLGTIESILISITAGFSVDYVVHLAHAYEAATGSTYERVTTACGDMGISVLNGMITSVAASMPLFFCQLQFFRKFGIFLCLTIAFSWTFANFAFMSLLSQLKIPLKKKKMGCRL